MKLVSENSETVIAQRNALREVEWKVPALTANLLRICAGAGKPAELGKQIADLATLWSELEKHGPLPDDGEFHRMLDVERYPDLKGEQAPWERAVHKMVKGGLRMAAGHLLDQTPQRSAGEDLLFEGLEVIEAIRERNRAQVRGRQKPTRQVAKRAPRKAG